jgi:TatD DNase family protein
MFIDSHCHIHSPEFFPDNREDAYRRSIAASVKMIVVGTSVEDSQAALDFASDHDQVWASIGVHPHEAKEGWDSIGKLSTVNRDKLVAIGEIGLDYHYNNSPREIQTEALQAQIEIALRNNLPIIFHVRDAFDDFWPILDNFNGIRGVMHSFTDTRTNLEKGLSRGLYASINGISTFTKDADQQAMYGHIPLERLLIETDAPFLTPSPLRGKVNEPAFVIEVAKHQAGARGLSLNAFADATTANATALFSLN